MISKRLNQETPSKPFHDIFPYGLSWTTKRGNKKLEHFAYFPYDDYRSDYIKRFKREGGANFKRFKTKQRESH